MWGNGLSLLEHNVAPNQICAAGDWLVRNADLFPPRGVSVDCSASTLHYAFPVSQRIASMMTLVERWTSCQTTLRSIPSCAPSSGKTNNTTIRIINP